VKELRQRFVANELPRFMGYFTERLERHPYLCGDTLTIADLRVLPRLRYFMLGRADHVPTDVIDQYPVVRAWGPMGPTGHHHECGTQLTPRGAHTRQVRAWVDRMLALPAIQRWYADPAH